MQRPLRSPWPAVAAIALAAAVLRALAFSGTELYADEAYYWLWSRRPAAGYFDHPPLVAWLVAAGTRLAPGEIGVRCLFLVSGALAIVFAALLARELAETNDASRARAGLQASSARAESGSASATASPAEARARAAEPRASAAAGRAAAPPATAVDSAAESSY